MRAAGSHVHLGQQLAYLVGLTVWTGIGIFFLGLVFGGNHKWKVWDYIFGPQQPGDDRDDEDVFAKKSATE